MNAVVFLENVVVAMLTDECSLLMVNVICWLVNVVVLWVECVI